MACEGLTGVEAQLCRAAEAAEAAARAAQSAAEAGGGFADAFEKIAGAISALLIPVALIIVIWWLRPYLGRILERRSFTIKVAGFELSAQEATDQLRKQVEDLQAKVAELADGGATGAGRVAPKSGPVGENDGEPDGHTEVEPDTGPDGDPNGDPNGGPNGGPNGDPGGPPAGGSASSGGALTESAWDIPAPAPQDGPRPPGARRILWIDDHPANNALLIAAFREEGVEVTTALSTADGIALLHDTPERYGVVITDQGRIEDGQPRSAAGNDLIRAMRAAGFAHPVAVFASPRGVRAARGADLATSSTTDLRRFVARHVRRADAD